jgi:hypothetical protein
MVTVQELEEIVKRLKADRDAHGNDKIRDIYSDAIDRLSLLAQRLREDLP